MIENLPSKIYLQVFGDEEPLENEVINFDDLSEISWCQDKIYPHDLEYVNAEYITRFISFLLGWCRGYGFDFDTLLESPKTIEAALKEFNQ